MTRFMLAIVAGFLLTGCGKDKSGDGPVQPKTPEQKDVVVLTPAANTQVCALMQETGSKYLRVSVGDKQQYKLDLDDNRDPKNDELFEIQGVSILIDRQTLAVMPRGSIIDFVDAGGTKGFKFEAPAAVPGETSTTLVEARRGFKTKLARRESDRDPPPQPPARLFSLVHYDSPIGKMAAYLTPDPKAGKKLPAIIWITGGDCNSIGDCWQEGPPNNEQSASAYRKAGIIMMFPSLRGGNGNPGVKEGFLGEVDDVIAAAEFLRKQTYVDLDRIYLGGHSTGGTLALLTAECSDRFRAVFSFGPVDDVLRYGPEYRPFSVSERKESELRSPGRWLHCIRSPVFVFEGSGGNASSLRNMARDSKNAKVQFFEIRNAEHFNILAPTNRLIAEKVLRDTGATCNLTFTVQEVSRPFAR